MVTRVSGDDLLGWKVALSLQAVPLALGILFLALVRMPQPVSSGEAAPG
jgi:hypothetical protein